MNKYSCVICDPIGHLRQVVTDSVRAALGTAKCDRTIAYLGCDIQTFRAHIESTFEPRMSWENYGEWQIDHIIPIKYPGVNGPPSLEEVAARLHYTNTQALWKRDNIAKGNRWVGGAQRPAMSAPVASSPLEDLTEADWTALFEGLGLE